MAVGVGGAEPQRVGGEQAQDREADPLLLEQLGAGGAGQRQGQVADPQRDDLRVADRGDRLAAAAEAELGEAAAAVDLDRPRRPPSASALVEALIRAQHLAAAARAGRGRLGDRQAQLRLPLRLDRRRQDRDEEVVGEVLAGLLGAPIRIGSSRPR